MRPDNDDTGREDEAGETGGYPHGKGTVNLLGQLLVEQGKISEQDIDRIFLYAIKRNLRFGEAAVKLGLISSKDLDHAMAAQFDYPYLEKGAGGYSSSLVSAYDPFSSKGNALRILRAQLLMRWFTQGRKTLAIVGSRSREGCSYVAANLAVVFSQLGERTLLIDTDLKNACQHKLFNINNDMGLSSALVGRTAIESVIKKLPLFRDLSVAPAGAPPPNPYDLLGRDEFSTIISRLQQQYSVILFDTPPFIENLGAEAIAHRCGGALLVVRKNRSRMSDVRNLTQAMRGVGAEIVGSAMCQF